MTTGNASLQSRIDVLPVGQVSPYDAIFDFVTTKDGVPVFRAERAGWWYIVQGEKESGPYQSASQLRITSRGIPVFCACLVQDGYVLDWKPRIICGTEILGPFGSVISIAVDGEVVTCFVCTSGKLYRLRWTAT
jgi:hypothetical protein